MSIKSIFIRIKDWGLENERELVIISSFLLISAISFGLGVLWQKDHNIKSPITVNKHNLAANIDNYVTVERAGETIRDDNGRIFVASKRGKYYHLPECTGAKSIKLENRIEFKTREEAEKSGYKPAGNCPGLK